MSGATWSRSVVGTADSADVESAVRMLQQLARQEGYSSGGSLRLGHSIQPDAELWTLRTGATRRGCLVFIPGNTGWQLAYAYISRTYRRKGMLAMVWPRLRRRYGNFPIYSPSPAMRTFLEKRACHPTTNVPNARGLREVKARYAGRCKACGEPFYKWASIAESSRGWGHVPCAWKEARAAAA